MTRALLNLTAGALMAILSVALVLHLFNYEPFKVDLKRFIIE